MAFPYDAKKKPLVTPTEERNMFGEQAPFATVASEESHEDVVIAPHSPITATQFFTVPDQQQPSSHDGYPSTMGRQNSHLAGSQGGERLPTYEESRPSTSTSPSVPLLQAPLSPSTTHYSTIPIPPPDRSSTLGNESRAKQYFKSKGPFVFALLVVTVGPTSWYWPVAGIVIGSITAILLVNIVIGIVFGYMSRRRRKLVLYLAILGAIAFITAWASHTSRQSEEVPKLPPASPTPAPPTPGPPFEQTLRQFMLAPKTAEIAIAFADNSDGRIELIQTEQPTADSRAVFSLIVRANDEKHLQAADFTTSQSGNEFGATILRKKEYKGIEGIIVTARLIFPPGYPNIREVRLTGLQGTIVIDMLGVPLKNTSLSSLLMSPFEDYANVPATEINELSITQNIGEVILNGVLSSEMKVQGTKVNVTGNACVRRELRVTTTSGDVDFELSQVSHKDRLEAVFLSTLGSINVAMTGDTQRLPYQGYFSMIGKNTFVKGDPANIHYSQVTSQLVSGWVSPGGKRPTHSSSVDVQARLGEASLCLQPCENSKE